MPPALSSDQQTLVLRWFPYARKVAVREQHKFPAYMDREEAKGIAALALCRCIASLGNRLFSKITLARSICSAIRRRALIGQVGSYRLRARLQYLPFQEEIDVPSNRTDSRWQDIADGRNLFEYAEHYLPSRLFEIVRRLYVEQETQVSIAQSLGLSQERVRQLHVKALQRLRKRIHVN
jgi:RNA polymerase sigma factor (sigma-70 family)